MLDQRFQTGAAITTMTDRIPASRLADTDRVRSERQPATRCGAAQPKWLRTATRRDRPKYSNQKPLERTQNWIKLGGKVRGMPHHSKEVGRVRIAFGRGADRKQASAA